MRRLLVVVYLVSLMASAWSVPLGAQQASTPVIGFLSTASASSRGSDQILAFHRGLQEAGYSENSNVTIEYRWASDNYSRLDALADELVRLNVAVIVAAGGHVSAIAAHKATKSIPIVFTTVTDPVKYGLVSSYNKPGGNATGTAGLTSELDPKRLEILHELVPNADVIGALVNPNRPNVQDQVKDLQVAADKLKVKLEFRKASTEREIDAAFASFASQRVAALVVTADPFFNNRRAQVVSLAGSTAIPAIYQWRQFVLAGGLVSYGPSITEAYQQAGRNAGQVLKGIKPAEIPVVQPTRFELSVNRWTARQLGLNMPDSFLMRVDEVIE